MSPHNLTLVERMPPCYSNLNVRLEAGKTVYVVPYSLASAGQDVAAFVKDAPQGPQFSDFTDGASNTVLVLEVDQEAAVVWTDPAGDWEFDPADPMRSLGSARPVVFLVTYADGSYEAIPNSIPPSTLKAKFTRAAGD